MDFLIKSDEILNMSHNINAMSFITSIVVSILKIKIIK